MDYKVLAGDDLLSMGGGNGAGGATRANADLLTEALGAQTDDGWTIHSVTSNQDGTIGFMILSRPKGAPGAAPVLDRFLGGE